MAKLNEISQWLDEYLNIHIFDENCWNGVQIEGKEEVKKIALSMDACQETFEGAVTAGADMLLTHHGHFRHRDNPSLVGWKKKRVKTLLAADISLYAAHLPLDAHPEVGNNAQILKILGAKPEYTFCEHGKQNVGWIGRLDQPKSVADIEFILADQYEASCVSLPFGPEQVTTIAVCSGGAGYGGVHDAIAAKVDLFITGDQVDVYQTAKETKINIIFAGHYATETCGVQALGEKLKEKFGVETVFIDAPTGL